MVGTYPIGESLRIQGEPLSDLFRTYAAVRGEYVDLVVAMCVESSSQLQGSDAETQRLLHLVAALDAVEEMMLGPVVWMMLGDFLKELNTLAVPADDVVPHLGPSRFQ